MHIIEQEDRSVVQVMAYSQRLQQEGKLAERLQTTLELESLLAIYGSEVRQAMGVTSLAFAAEETVFAVFGHIEQQPQHQAALHADNQYLGELVYSKQQGFSAADLKRLAKYHQQLVFPLRNALQYAKLRRQAMFDPMTGAGNRLLLTETLQRAIVTKQRAKLDTTLLLLDLDGFKQVNDTAGHLVGDAILKRFVEVVKAQLRGYDSLYRYGGDEFVVLLQEADASSSQLVFTRIKQAVLQDPLLSKHKVGCSAGAVALSDTCDERSLMAQADSALYRAKRSGKGVVKFAKQDNNEATPCVG
ncbi:GGDEF domain-containing protein [Aliidiomarina taiwanensis]|uniref:diguanylate cyclase n=1 Tax=Aliidiomarina taiwanensis TaxID=946228 RepID=A0A432X1W2_9GAMM|nr:GGDEF domain-containing protein [Aliidiomarina taiwanensis]RUO40484.1 GGDEF domain-containing protein [Aliidiomarina taiwanensis]